MDVIIVGGGVVGLSCAYELAVAGYRTVVLERRGRFGEETSTHNSGVIHAGIYYDRDSWKARLCVSGRRLLIERLTAWGIAHRLGGKLIVAVEDIEVGQLENLLQRGRANGVEQLDWIEPAAALRREPQIRLRAALLSAGSGVFDAGEYLHGLAGRCQERGALLVAGAEVIGVDDGKDAVRVTTALKGAVTGRVLINAAGLHADEIASLCGETGHRIYPCRGEYASVIPRRTALIRDLVYPVPDPVSLGVHLTRTVQGELWIGPDARFVERRDDYESDRRPAADFLAPAQRLCPELSTADLRLGPSGIRPRRTPPGEPLRDFHLARQSDRPNVIHLIGIESPGLTASPAIGRRLREMVEETMR
ncbi:MAG: FAD-dependent oxidoreductase [Myxococcales bacterium]|nr:FAD-dependent oxidoreductase [Myxococcales bacterium]